MKKKIPAKPFINNMPSAAPITLQQAQAALDMLYKTSSQAAAPLMVHAQCEQAYGAVRAYLGQEKK